jgi:hypothetical protein
VGHARQVLMELADGVTENEPAAHGVQAAALDGDQ